MGTQQDLSNSPLFFTVNLMAIGILSLEKSGLSTCTIRYLVAMAMTDLLVIFFEVILWQIKHFYFPLCFLDITAVCSVHAVLIAAATDCSVWFTVTFSFDRFVAICCQKLKTKYCSKKTSTVVLSVTGVLLCIKNVPSYFTIKPRWVIRNVSWFCDVKTQYFTEPGWVGYNCLDTILTPFLPITLIFLLNALTVRHILMASKVRKGLRGQKKGANCSDPEMENRRKSIILLFSISGTFVFLWMTHVVEFFYYNITQIDGIEYTRSWYILQQVGFMLRSLSCCTNAFIYVMTQSKFREKIKKMLNSPFIIISRIINSKNTSA